MFLVKAVFAFDWFAYDEASDRLYNAARAKGETKASRISLKADS